MPLTPSDVANKQFARAMRGYSMEEVDLFLDEVEQELSRLLSENAKLSQQASAPAPAAGGTSKPDAPADAPPATDTQEAALRTLLMAQRTADQVVAEAKAEADRLLTDARRKSATTEQEINARIANAMAQLEADRAAAEQRVEELKAFEREYRLRLRAYLEGQLRELDTKTTGEGPGAGVPAAARAAAIGGATPAAAPPAPPPAPATPAGPESPPAAPVAAAPSEPEAEAPAGPPRQAGGAPGSTLQNDDVPRVGPFVSPARTAPAAPAADQGEETPPSADEDAEKPADEGSDTKG